MAGRVRNSWSLNLKNFSSFLMPSFCMCSSAVCGAPPSSSSPHCGPHFWQQHPHTRLAQHPLFLLTMKRSWMMTMLGNQTTQKKKFHATQMAANVPKVAMAGTSMIEVSTKAPIVVAVVTSIAVKARVHVHARRLVRKPLTRLGCRRDCFHASINTNTSSAPIPRMMKMMRTWLKVKLLLPMIFHDVRVRTNEMTICDMPAMASITDPTCSHMMMPTASSAPIESSASARRAWKKTGPIMGELANLTLISSLLACSSSMIFSIFLIHPSALGSPVNPGNLNSSFTRSFCSSGLSLMFT
mmetsp:Transcript_59936/g.147344  ORF Transcript_59936/g.147344 Transcript_59936/m.147344 type:complete len:298 (+) Transcript_59936:1461-2354(+)